MPTVFAGMRSLERRQSQMQYLIV